jgi:hypothetical protein
MVQGPFRARIRPGTPSWDGNGRIRKTPIMIVLRSGGNRAVSGFAGVDSAAERRVKILGG